MNDAPGPEIKGKLFRFVEPMLHEKTMAGRKWGTVKESGKVVRLGERKTPLDELRCGTFATASRQCHNISKN